MAKHQTANSNFSPTEQMIASGRIWGMLSLALVDFDEARIIIDLSQ
jgi:hypothetical protein